MRRPRRSSTTPPHAAGTAGRSARSVLSFAGLVAVVAVAAAAVTPAALQGVSLPGVPLPGFSLPMASVLGVSLPALLAALPTALVAVATAATWRRRAQLLSGWGAAGLAGLAAAGGLLAVDVAWVLTAAPASGDAVLAALAVLPARAGAALVVVTVAARAGWNGAPRATPAEAGGAVAVRARGLHRSVSATVTTALVGAVLVVPAQAAAAATAAPTTKPCTAGEQQRSYSVAAATVDVPFNRWGARLKSARIFVLEQDLAATKYWSRPLAASPSADPAKNRRLRPRPLVLRANEGECIEVRLTNRLSTSRAHGLPGSPRVGISASGVVVDARRAGGARVGYNADPTVAIGESITYYWRVPAQEGLFLFSDMATPAGGEHDGGSRGVGLYGALAVEPAGSVWTDPRSGAVLSGTPGQPKSTYTAVSGQSGELYVEADIHPPNAPSFRESVQIAQDEIPGIGMGFNYGAEPLEAREARACPDCVGEETWLSSWPYGDPALVKLASGPGPWLPTAQRERSEREDCGLVESCFVSNVFHTYTGDPTKIRFGLAGVKETHVFHLHAHQWLADPSSDASQGEGVNRKPESTTVDSQSFGPGEAFSAELLFGAGSANGTFGDSIFHCHLYPHFADGFWSLMRVHDVLIDGSTATPDGVAVRPLVPLPGVPELPEPTADNPGYPGMIPGTFGFRAPQPPGSVTEGGVDGTPERAAPRLVAGRAIDDAKLRVERAVVARHNDGGEGPAGAPYADPCPTGAREVDYDVTVLQRDLVYNDRGDHDPQARFMVLTKDVPDVLAGRKSVEPLFVRVNAGDCINFSLTNMTANYVGGDAFQLVGQTNMTGAHVHLVKFDVTASDGGSNGWNYQQAAFTRQQAELTAQQASGEVTCTPAAGFYGGESTGCIPPNLEDWTAPADSTGLWGQTIHERWYADYELRTAFTHDHHFPAMAQHHGYFGALVVEPAGFDVRDPGTGAFAQPINDPANGPVCGTRCQGTAVGASVDLVGPGANDDYREHGLAVQDFVPLVLKDGDPRDPDDVVNPPAAPEPWPANDPGTFAVNYRNAPLVERGRRNGKPVDPAHRFSSWVFGDPETPLLQGYARDNVKLRIIQGSQEEQHMFQVHGLRWREEPDDPGSPLVNAQTIGISEAFNAELPGFDCAGTDVPCRGDYLYGATTPEGLWNGMWGILRVHGRRTPDLLPLPDNPPRPGAVGAPTPAGASRPAPPAARRPGTACPTGAPVRSYDVVAMDQDVVWNEFGDHDPKGLLYVLAENEAAVRSGAMAPEPLVLRANAGDCVKVSLRNGLSPAYGKHVNGVDGDIPLPLEPATGTPMGTRVSLHPQLLRHDVRLSDGAAVGFNPDSTAGIGQTVSYEWYADTELGGTNLVDYGDVRGHRHHGLYAALTIEPRHATYHDPVTGAPVRSGVTADIRVPGRSDFRETTLLYSDAMDLRTVTGSAVAPVVPPGDADEPGVGEGREDLGEAGVNYANAPLHRRLGAAPGVGATSSSRAWASVFSSVVHGDPRTPVLRAYADDDLRVRVLNGSAKPPVGYFGGFQLDGAAWRAEPYDAESELVGVQGNIGPGRAVNVHARLSSAGDHLWTSPTSLTLPRGLWGLARVYPRPAESATFTPTAIAAQDSPFGVAKAPLQPLERSSLSVQVFTDTDADGVQDAGEPAASGVPVRVLTAGGAQVLAGSTGAGGTVAFSPQRGAYDVEVDAPAGTAAVGGARRRVDLTGDASRVELSVGLATATPVRALVFDDRDGNGARGEDEPGLPGWTVTLEGGPAVEQQVSAADGTATFTDVTGTGERTVAVQPRSGWRATTPPVTVALGGVAAEVAAGVARSTGLVVRPVDDVDGDGLPGAGEPTLGGLRVEVTPDGGAPTRDRTDADGAVVETGGAAARVRVLRPDTGAPWACTVARVTAGEATTTVPCAVDGSVAVPAGAGEVVLLRGSDEGVVTTVLFADTDRDGRRDAGEAPLADWPVTLVGRDGGAVVASTTTDETGTAGLVVAPGSYDVVPVPPATAVAWVPTTGAQRVEVTRAGSVEVASGWVQPGSVSVGVFSDLDRNGVRDAGDDPLADRTVTLLGSTGAVLGRQVTDGTGRAAFPVTAGTSYRVSVAVPTSWQATAPRAGTSVLTTVPVTAPADGGPVDVEVGHYNTVDRQPPPAPVADPGTAVLSGPSLVTLRGESGATLRYTLDGTAPTATRGTVYTGPVRISVDRVLRAVAIDAAGNVSPDLSAAYDLPWSGASAALAPSSWAVTTGGTAGGGAGETATVDRRYLTVGSGKVGNRPAVDVTATAAVPAHLRKAAALSVSATLRTTLRGTRVRLQWWDASTGNWRVLGTTTAGLEDARFDVDLGAASKAVATDGSLEVRVLADNRQPFDLAVDQVAVTLVNRR